MALIKCKCGCGQELEDKDSRGRPRSRLYGHNINCMDHVKRFWNYVNKNSGTFGKFGNYPTECWEWTGFRNKSGHATFTADGITTGVHRYSFKLEHGYIDENLPLDHLCQNPPCVRPDHLDNVTQRTNLFRANSITGINMRKTHCIHGHLLDKDNTYLYKGERGCKICRYINGWDVRKHIQLICVGDIHGKYDLAEAIIKKALIKYPNTDAIIHPGDAGFSWPTRNTPHVWNYPFKLPFFWAEGNHDVYTPFLKNNEFPSWMFYQPRGSIRNFAGKKVLWCGGAFSIDRAYRTLNQTYWLEETIKQADLDKCLAQQGPIDLLVTHETAENYLLKAKKPEFTEGKSDRLAVQAIVDKFKPKYHIHGHWHLPDNGDYIHKDGSITKWTCIPEVDSGHFAVWDGENLQLSWLDTADRP